MRYGSLFTGVGGFDLGFDRAGMECLWQCEKDPMCQRILTHHWPFTLRHDDVVRLRATIERGNEPSRPDVICGGFPCQDLSVAGQRAGLAGGRSGLWFVFRRIVAKLRPAWVLIENVPGLLSSNSGRDMGTILAGLGNMGYGFAYRVLDSQWFGLAQRRQRVFIIGCLGDHRRAAQVLFDPTCMPWDPAPSREAGQGVAAGLTRGAESGRKTGYSGRRREDDVNLVADALKASDGGVSGGCHEVVAQCLGAHHYRCNQEQDTFVTSFAENQRGEVRESDIAPQLSCGGGKPGSGYSAVAFQTRIARNGRGQPKDITDALTSAESGSHGDSRPHVADETGVRRLTPRECERLQGFPDDWTLTGADGEQMLDSPRYRMLGNAVSVPVIEWIGRRMMEVQHDRR